MFTLFAEGSWFTFLGDAGGVIVSLISGLFVVGATVRHFLLKERPSHLHFAMHFPRWDEEVLKLKLPTMSRMVLTEIYDYYSATWLLLCAKRWARQSPFSPVLVLPTNGHAQRWRRWLGRCVPDRDAFLGPLRKWLSEPNFEDWRDRAVAAARDPRADPQEELFIIALVKESGSRTLRAVVVPLAVLESILKDPNYISDIPHPNYAGAPERPATIKRLALAYAEWRMCPTKSRLAITLLEL